MLDPSRKLALETEAAKLLREQLASIATAGDEDDGDTLVRDTIEGETNLHEIAAEVLAAIGEDEAMLAGLAIYTDGLALRRKRIEDRIDHRRLLLAQALQVAELPKLVTPVATATLTPVRPKPVVTDEASIPSRFWKAADPKLDRKALGDALKAGEAVPGAELSNGGVTVTIRRR